MASALHHGTLLRDVDMGVLAAVLSPNKAKLQVSFSFFFEKTYILAW
jgi:lipoate-protein ligase A